MKEAWDRGLVHLQGDWGGLDPPLPINPQGFVCPTDGMPGMPYCGFKVGSFPKSLRSDTVGSAGRALSQAPPDWPRKNLQFVLGTRIVDHAPDRS
jgi:hypothetical protein